MSIKQISVFVENRPGALGAIANALAAAKVDIQALSIADTTEFGVLRLIVADNDVAVRALRDAGFHVTLTDVLAVSIAHQPGGLAAALNALGDEVSVEYCYAFIGANKQNAYVVLRPGDVVLAGKLLEKGGLKVLTAEEIFA